MMEIKIQEVKFKINYFIRIRRKEIIFLKLLIIIIKSIFLLILYYMLSREEGNEYSRSGMTLYGRSNSKPWYIMIPFNYITKTKSFFFLL
jgi:hypothetical protein